MTPALLALRPLTLNPESHNYCTGNSENDNTGKAFKLTWQQEYNNDSHAGDHFMSSKPHG